LLEARQISRAESIRLGDHGDQVDSGAQSLHHLNIKRLQGVASWSDEVQTCVDAQVNLVHTAWLLLLQHVRLMLVIQKLDNRHPGVAVVDIVAETWGIDNR
jgi:hypothetical protein